jgi:hypothetical protein
MAAVAKRLTHRIVAPTLEGSTPFGRPTYFPGNKTHDRPIAKG